MSCMIMKGFCFISGNVILLIDEVHTLVGSGSAGRGGSGGGGLDIANLLKPPLARGELQVFLQILLSSTIAREPIEMCNIISFQEYPICPTS